ncbi:DUF2877 domain-containing protein [Nitrososphaera sp.]|uniref:oxamate carbamoyltransferase subunit AllH family protein n=1 Tax=Nitrososphaera sp. TaxID=1971748 RepID=UPI002ED862F4
MEAETLSSAGLLDCYCIGGVHSALAQSRGKIGRAINVFDKTINIRTVEDELLVITLGSMRSPANLNLSEGPLRQAGFAYLVRESQDAVAKVDHTGAKPRIVLQVGSIAISIDEPDVFQNSLQEPAAESLHTFAASSDRIFSVLAGGAGKERAGCLLNPDVTTMGLLPMFLDRLASGNTSNEQDLLAEALMGLCGRGPGFTPAGDDFIAGYLAVSNWLSNSLKLGPHIIPGKEFSRLTTWTSFKLMEYSARGLIDDQAQLMINSVARGSVDDYIICIGLIGKRGHTSGIDFATGATVALYTIADRVCGTRTLDHISDLQVRH